MFIHIKRATFLRVALIFYLLFLLIKNQKAPESSPNSPSYSAGAVLSGVSQIR